jgi:hypothetical protein
VGTAGFGKKFKEPAYATKISRDRMFEERRYNRVGSPEDHVLIVDDPRKAIACPIKPVAQGHGEPNPFRCVCGAIFEAGRRHRSRKEVGLWRVYRTIAQ